eukprot:3295222-Amphidinium_carterae.2
MCGSHSKYTCVFSDLPWPAEAQDFPCASDVQNYLRDYAVKFDLLRCVSFGCEVLSVEPVPSHGKVGSDGWQVKWQAADKPEMEVFAHVVAASGIFEAAHVPSLPGLSSFNGETIHSSSYKDSAPYKNKTVLVVGAAFSGADIASLISHVARSVTVAAPRPVWYIPRFIGGKPLDLWFYSRAAAATSSSLSDKERNLERH